MQILTLIYLRPLLRLRRQMRHSHPAELEHMLTSLPMVQTHRAIFGTWYTELAILQEACFLPIRFPVHVFANERTFDLVKRIRRGVLVQLYGYCGLIIIKSLKDL